MAEFEEDAPIVPQNYTNMSLSELDDLYDSAEKDFNSAFKAASEKLVKSQKYEEAQIQALVKSEKLLTKLIEGYRSNLAADGKIQDK